MTNRLPQVTDTTLAAGMVTRLVGTPVTEHLPVRHNIMPQVRREPTIKLALNSARGHPISRIVPCMFLSPSRFPFFGGLTDEWSRPRCSDSPPVSPVTSTPDYFINQSSSSSASSPTSPASPVNGYHYSWQHTHAHQSDGHYTPTDLPPQYNPQGQGNAHNPFQPCVYHVPCV